VGKRIYVNDNVGWGENVHVDLGRDDDYWDWENNMETEALRWRSKVEYVMTEKGLERVDKNMKQEDEDVNDNNETLEEFRKSREQLEREKEQKARELQEIDRELKKTDDSTRYHYQQPDAPAAPRTPAPKATPIRRGTAMAPMQFGIHDPLLLAISF
jgi:hypothetical protein